jgi:hypothetical protein
MNKRFLILAGLLALILCLSGCAKDSDDDEDIGDFANTWTGSLTSTADPAMVITLPIVITIDKDGKTAISWHYANDVDTNTTDSCEVDGNKVSFAIKDTFDTHMDTPATSTGTLSCTGTLGGDSVIRGTYTLVYDTAGVASDSGTFAVSNQATSIVGTWKGAWMAASGYSDNVTVVFKSDSTFTVSGGSDYVIDIPGTWSISGTTFTASSANGSVKYYDNGSLTDTDYFGAGSYSATANGSCLISGAYSVKDDPFTYTATGSWSLGKVF